MANSKIKQILVGSTTYDIEDSSAAHLSTDNTFSGSNTFEKPVIIKSTSNQGSTTYSQGSIVYQPSTTGSAYILSMPAKNGTLALTSDVVANPAASGTTTLTTLQVGSTVYTLPSGGETYEVVELTSSQTTLTDDQYNTLIASPFNKIKYENKLYNLYQDTTSELVYTTNYLNNGYRININKTTKNITKDHLGSLTTISSFVKNNLTHSQNNSVYALSAYQGKVLNDRLTALENASGGGGVTSVTTSGTGNAVTSASISGNELTLTKGSTFLTAHQSLASCAKLSSNNIFTGTNTFKNPVTIKGTSSSHALKIEFDQGSTTYQQGLIQYQPSKTAGNTYNLNMPAKDGTLALTSDIPTVEANPSASGTATLTKLKVGSTVYTLPSGGGGGTAGVSSLGGKTGAITLGGGLSMSNNQLVPKIKNIYLDSSDYLCIETN